MLSLRVRRGEDEREIASRDQLKRERERKWVNHQIAISSARLEAVAALCRGPLGLQTEHARRWKCECNPVKVKLTNMLLDNVLLLTPKHDNTTSVPQA